MEKQTADLIMAKACEVLRDIGVDPMEFADAVAKQLTGKPLTRAAHPVVERSFQETLSDFIEKYPEPSQEQLAQLLIKFKTAGPEMRKLLIEKARNIPTRAGGRPRELAKNNAEARLCMLISQQLADGIEKPEAVQNAATRFAVSYWTAKRAWKRYQEAAKGKTASPKKKTQRRTRDSRARPR
jgi:hypothetical protein